MITDYPRIREAVATCRSYADAAWRNRRNGYEAYARSVRAWEKAANDSAWLYAEELGPVLFGGKWELAPLPELVTELPPGCSLSLLEHLRTIRRVGAKYPATWQDTFFIAEPLDVIDSGGTTESAEYEAKKFKDKGIAIWAREDLSIRHPDTCLVIVSPLLMARHAWAYGFHDVELESLRNFLRRAGEHRKRHAR